MALAVTLLAGGVSWLVALFTLVKALSGAGVGLVYGLGRAIAVALAVTLLAGGVSWLVALFTLVKALSGAGVGLVWAILLFATPTISVLALGALALRILPPRYATDRSQPD